MTEQICWGTTGELLPIVEALDYLTESLMMLERVPSAFLPDAERENGICLRKYDISEKFDNWERGRIFHNNFELRWERQEDAFAVVYIGEPKRLPRIDNKLLSEFQDESYYLWGEKMTADTLKRINQRETVNLFLELQIPRLLSYPVSNGNEKFRVKLSARHYLNPETSALEFYRFRQLEEV